MAEKGQVLSVNRGVQRGEHKEAVKKCDATRPGPDPELSRANGKTRKESWILLQRDCNRALQRAQDPPSLLHSRPLSSCQAEANPAEMLFVIVIVIVVVIIERSIFTAVKVSYE